jgi:hypothetical protein
VLRTTLAGMDANALRKVLQSSTIIARFKAISISSSLFSSLLLLQLNHIQFVSKMNIFLLYTKYMTNMWLKLGLLNNMYFPINSKAMESFYGPSIPLSTSSILLEAVKDEKRPEDRAFLKSNDNTEEVLHNIVDKVINMILEEVLKEEDIDHVFSEEDLIVEASKTAEEVVWPLDDPNPVVINQGC